MTNTRLLKAKIIEIGKTYGELAAAVGICETSLRNKINDKSPFKATEIATLCHELNIGDKDKYFFVIE